MMTAGGGKDLLNKTHEANTYAFFFPGMPTALYAIVTLQLLSYA